MPAKLPVEKIAELSGHQSAVYALVCDSLNPSQLLSAGGDGWIVRWNLAIPETGQLVAKVNGQTFSLESCPDEQLLVAGDMNGGIHWLYRNEPARNRHIAHHRKGIFAIRRLGKWVYSLGAEGLLSRWALQEARCVEGFRLSNKSLRSLAYNPAFDELAIGASDGRIYLLDATKFQLRAVVDRAHDHSVFALRYSPDGQYLLSGGRDAQLRVWDRKFTFPSHTIAAHLATINAIAYHPEGQLFATASRDKTIKLWDAAGFDLLKVIERVRDGGHANSVNCLWWSNYQNLLCSAGDDRLVNVWQVG